MDAETLDVPQVTFPAIHTAFALFRVGLRAKVRLLPDPAEVAVLLDVAECSESFSRRLDAGVVSVDVKDSTVTAASGFTPIDEGMQV